MASLGLQMLASALSLLGWVGTIICCAMPFWRVTAFVGASIITAETIWEGIWMSCVVLSTGQMQCKVYDSLLALSSDLQAARALTVLAIVTGATGLLLAFIGGKCTRFLEDAPGRTKVKVGVAAGGVLIAAGLLCLIPTSWTAHVVVSRFYSAGVDAQRREIGASLYIGWAASVLLVLGGGLLISSSGAQEPHKRSASTLRYVAVRMSNGSGTAASGPRAPVSPPGQQVSAKPPWADGSVRSEGSKAPSTKSQLKPDDAANSSSLESVKTEGSKDASSNPAKTYL